MGGQLVNNIELHNFPFNIKNEWKEFWEFKPGVGSTMKLMKLSFGASRNYFILHGLECLRLLHEKESSENNMIQYKIIVNIKIKKVIKIANFPITIQTSELHKMYYWFK